MQKINGNEQKAETCDHDAWELDPNTEPSIKSSTSIGLLCPVIKYFIIS